MSIMIAPLVFQIALPSAASALVLVQVWSVTLLQIQVLARVTATIDRFRFSFKLLVEAPTHSAAMALLNQRLDRARQERSLFLLVTLTNLFPRSYSSGSCNPSRPTLERATMRIGGEVSRDYCDSLI